MLWTTAHAGTRPATGAVRLVLVGHGRTPAGRPRTPGQDHERRMLGAGLLAAQRLAEAAVAACSTSVSSAVQPV